MGSRDSGPDHTDHIEPTVLDLEPDSPGAAPAGLPGGGRIGPYQVVTEIGRGGMGAVYLAVRADDQYHKRVAIKLVKKGMDSEDILARFRHERQILANLDHPNIARLLDGGTTEEGVPYFVMEHIEGVPIDRYCLDRALPVPARLRLFRQVLAAVHCAHQNLVVHRDLKPGNILVTSDGTPKLLDFGIAKLLRPEGTVTQTLTTHRVMTPDYASPEQVRGEAITTATDVYSLGVILYELLAGRRPYRVQGVGLEELQRVVCHEDPTRPSAAVTRLDEGQATLRADERPRLERLRRELKGDLDNVVLMAMRKEPARRYASAEQFSEDVRRHLEGLPVIARSDTPGYRAAKFVARHKGAVVAAGMVALSLVGGLVATSREARVARLQKARAERRFEDVRRLAHSFIFEIHDAIQDLAGSTRARELLVKRGLEYLDGLTQESGGDEELEAELAAAYLRVGDVQGRPGYANLGDRAGALASYRKAVSLLERVADKRPTDAAVRRDLAAAHDRVGDALRLTGGSADALASYRRALALREGAGGESGPSATTPGDRASSYQRIADVLAQTGDAKGAEESQRRALAIFEEQAARTPDDARAQRDLFIASIKTGDRLRALGDHPASLERYRRALELAEPLAAADPANARAQRELAVAVDKVGNALGLTGDEPGALAQFRRAMTVRASLAARDRDDAELRRDLSISHEKIGEHLLAAGRAQAALESFRAGLQLDQAGQQADPSNVQARLDVSSSHENVGRALAKLSRLDEALASYERAEEIRRPAAEVDPGNAQVRLSLAGLYGRFGELYAERASRSTGEARRAQWRQARSWYQRARESLLELKSRDSLPGEAAAEPDRLAAEIARGDAALGR